MLATGGTKSATVRRKVQVVVLPQSSCAVYVTVWVPSGSAGSQTVRQPVYRDPSSCCYLKVSYSTTKQYHTGLYTGVLLECSYHAADVVDA
jgi:hypothetical protein